MNNFLICLTVLQVLFVCTPCFALEGDDSGYSESQNDLIQGDGEEWEGDFLLPPNTDENGEGQAPGYLNNVTEEPAADSEGTTDFLVNRDCPAAEYGDQPPFPTAVVHTGGWYLFRNRASWLPPDPGEAGKETIAGVDNDGDCVRDDIENYIATKVPTAEDRQGRKHLFAYAKWLGQFLQDDLSVADAKELTNLMYVASQCARQTLGDTLQTTDKLEKVFARFHNTFPRSYKYIENNALLGGWSTREKIEISCEE